MHLKLLGKHTRLRQVEKAFKANDVNIPLGDLITRWKYVRRSPTHLVETEKMANPSDEGYIFQASINLLQWDGRGTPSCLRLKGAAFCSRCHELSILALNYIGSMRIYILSMATSKAGESPIHHSKRALERLMKELRDWNVASCSTCMEFHFRKASTYVPNKISHLAPKIIETKVLLMIFEILSVSL